MPLNRIITVTSVHRMMQKLNMAPIIPEVGGALLSLNLPHICTVTAKVNWNQFTIFVD